VARKVDKTWVSSAGKLDNFLCTKIYSCKVHHAHWLLQPTRGKLQGRWVIK